jgi:hypothetical protein
MVNKSAKKALEAKQKIQATEKELQHLAKSQWSYSKCMLKFGMASWIFGLSSFFSAMTILNISLLGASSSTWLPLLVLALAAPVGLTGVLVRKFAVRIKHLEIVKRKLLAEYEKAMLSRVGEMIITKQ